MTTKNVNPLQRVLSLFSNAIKRGRHCVCSTRKTTHIENVSETMGCAGVCSNNFTNSNNHNNNNSCHR